MKREGENIIFLSLDPKSHVLDSMSTFLKVVVKNTIYWHKKKKAQFIS